MFLSITFISSYSGESNSQIQKRLFTWLVLYYKLLVHVHATTKKWKETENTL